MSLENNMGKEWYQILSPFIETDTFKHLSAKIATEYKTKTIYPEKESVFKAFRLTPFSKVRVVWLGESCYSEPNQATGLSFGIDVGKCRIPLSLDIIITELESSYDSRLLLNFDYSLESWAKQGVLMLNTTLTTEKRKIDSHFEMWNPFIEEVFKTLNIYHTGLVFVLLGKKAERYESLINANQHIIKISYPGQDIKEGEIKFLGSRIFNKIDELIKQMNGDTNLIKWNENV